MNLFGGGSLRESRRELYDMLGSEPSTLYHSYPVVQEKCSCGSYTQIVDRDSKETAAHFAGWRKNHVCKKRNAQESGKDTQGDKESCDTGRTT